MPKGVPLTEELKNKRRKEIFETASGLFLDKGFNETSMKDIAEKTGMGKSTIYDYFENKDEIILYFLEEEMKLLNDDAREILKSKHDPYIKLKMLISKRIEFYKNKRSIALLLIYQAQKLSNKSILKWMSRREEYVDILQSVIEGGIDSGLFRKVNSRFSAQSLFNLVALMFLESFTNTVEEMTDKVLDLFMNGIRK
jgi:AcrR family transcriptional regulator